MVIKAIGLTGTHDFPICLTESTSINQTILFIQDLSAIVNFFKKIFSIFPQEGPGAIYAWLLNSHRFDLRFRRLADGQEKP